MARRELIDTGTGRRYVSRNAKGQFKESSRATLAERIRKAKARIKQGQGPKGGRKR